MAGFGEIPIPKQFSSMGELADLLMKKRTEQERSRQFNSQQQEQIRQFNENLRFKQAEENRTEKKFPYELQHLKDTHSTSMLNNMINRKAMERAEAAWPYIKQQYEDAHHGKVSEQGLADVKNETLRRSYQHELDLANQRDEQQNKQVDEAIPRNEPGDFLTQGMPQGQQSFPHVTPEAQQANVIPFHPQVSPQAQAEQVNNPMIQNAPGMAQQTPNTTPMPQQGTEGIGKEIVISEGDPNTAYKNIEGKPSQSLKNGFLIKTYPNGRTTAQKIPAEIGAVQKGMSLEDKFKLEQHKADLRKRNAEELAQKRQENTERTINRKVSDKIELGAKPLSEAAGYIKNMNDIIHKNKNATGLSYRSDILLQNFGAKDSAAFKGNAANLASQAALIEKSNPGSQMVGFFDKNKPNVGAAYDFNIGMLLANAEKIQGLYDFDKNNWERMNPGKKYPMKDPDLHEVINDLTKELQNEQNKSSVSDSQGDNLNWVWNVKENKWEQ